jgi:hypothetical protein
MKRVMKLPKKRIILIFIAVLIALAVLLFYPKSIGNISECESSSDCAPAGCCHAGSCVSADKKPDCSGIFCTQECVPGTLDCGQGSCACVSGKCTAKLADERTA